MRYVPPTRVRQKTAYFTGAAASAANPVSRRSSSAPFKETFDRRKATIPTIKRHRKESLRVRFVVLPVVYAHQATGKFLHGAFSDTMPVLSHRLQISKERGFS